VATAAYLLGAARHQLDAAGCYAEVRVQFGQRLIDFQGVAFPISKAVVDVLQAESMTMVAAAEQDRDEPPVAEPGVETAALAARVAAERAALQATYVAHQAMGAIGYTVEGPLAGHTLCIRQAALSVPLSDGDRHKLDVLAGLAEAGV
jgi:alkylation response protein AidB-like acyl-CoA dehydrogenase